MKVTIVLLFVAVCAVCGLDESDDAVQNQLSGIMGGKEIQIEKSPYVVAINTKDGKFVGNGVLLRKNWVLSAAGNFVPYQAADIVVRVGTEKGTSKGTTHEVINLLSHPRYQLSWQYNVALVKLQDPVTISDKVKTIPLAGAIPKAGSQAVVSGYGNTVYQFGTDAVLRQAVVPVIPYEQCKSHYTAYPVFTTASFCASKPGVGACPQDWGDPLVYNGKLIGIFSGSEGDCGSATYPGVFVDITKVTPWIKDVLKRY